MSSAAYVGGIMFEVNGVRAFKNVLDFRAVPGLDCTEQLQRALAHSSSYVTVFPSGTWFTSGLVVSMPQVLIFEPGAILRLVNGADVSVLQFVAGSGGSMVLGGGTIEGNRANQTPGSGSGIEIVEADNVHVGDVTVTGCADRGVLFKNSSGGELDRTKVYLTTAMGIQLLAQNGFTLSDFVAERCIVDRSDDPANDDGCIEVTCNVGGKVLSPRLSRNRVKMAAVPTGSNVVAIEFLGDPNVPGSLRDGIIEKNDVEGGQIGISVAANSWLCGVDHNHLRDQNGICIEVVESAYNTVDENDVDGKDHTPTGIVVNGNSALDASRNKLRGNTVYNCVDQNIYSLGTNAKLTLIAENVIPVLNSDTGTGIWLNTVGERTVILGNIIDGNGGAAVQGILITNSSHVVATANNITGFDLRAVQVVANNQAHSDFYICGNDLTGNTSGEIQWILQGTGTLNRTFGYPNLGQSRPAQTSPAGLQGVYDKGAMVFNKTTGRPNWWDGAQYIEADGTPA